MHGSRGFTAVEAIIGVLTFSILSVGVISLAIIGTRMAIDSERRVVALALVNERIEFIRSLPYEQIALAPDGALPQQEDAVRNQQKYELETLVAVVDPPANLKKKVQVTASWLVPAGGRRDVQVVTYVAEMAPSHSEQSPACVPGNSGWSKRPYAYASDFLDDAFRQCKNDCDQTSQNLPLWQCCGWSVEYTVHPGLTGVDATCRCIPPSGLPAPATDHPLPNKDEYTKLARKCADGTLCGKKDDLAVGGRLTCDANCLKEPGDCVCECP